MKASVHKQRGVDVMIPQTLWYEFFFYVCLPLLHSGFMKGQGNFDRPQRSARVENGTPGRRRGSRGMSILFVRIRRGRTAPFAGGARVARRGIRRGFGVGGDFRREAEVAEGLLVGIVKVPGCCILLIKYIIEINMHLYVIHKALSSCQLIESEYVVDGRPKQ